MDNGHEPATKKDLLELKNELKNEFKNELKNEISGLRSDMSGLRDEFREALHDTETRLLKAFYGFAESNQKRLAIIETDQSGVQSRLGTVEARLLEVEKRLNMPPHQ